MQLSVIVTCKDREENVSLCLSSIRACRPRPQTILVDFGSTRPLEFSGYRSWLRIIRVDRDTEMFHKARAINIGIRAVKTKFLCITDADQIFKPNFFGVVYATLRTCPTSFVMSRTYFLDRCPGVEFDLDGKIFSTLLQEAMNSKNSFHGDGCCNGIATGVAMKMRGYDETYTGYRAQDSDFALRAIVYGLQKIWVHTKTSMIHLPHQRVGDYYSDVNRTRNKQRYREKTHMAAKQIVIANADTPWGIL